MSLAVNLGARSVQGWSEDDEHRARHLPAISRQLVGLAQNAIRHGFDPLGETYMKLLSNEQRRPSGAIYTPQNIVNAMMLWAHSRSQPMRIIDPGSGSGRFLMAAAQKFTDARLIGIESNPIAAILARANLAVAGLAGRSEIRVQDYRSADLQPIAGQTLFVGNPPYVRHHLIDSDWKEWLLSTAKKYDCSASALAGLHAHFFLATAEFARLGDVGVFITSAEWLDVNYGRLIRELFLSHLGGLNLQIIEPTALPFPGVAATGVIAAFSVGARPPSICFRRVETLDDLGSLDTGRQVRRERLETANRWTPLSRTPVQKREGFVELGDLCRVHRGQVTGANQVWIANGNYLLPRSVLFPSVTKARELFRTFGILDDPSSLRSVIDIPVDLDCFSTEDRRNIDQYLLYAMRRGADVGYVARHRKAWWSVGLRAPAPILATYMARRPPIFVRNLAEARHINIAHGLYPRETLDNARLDAIAIYLSRSVSLADGRTYSGGLTKFEPREMERLMVPHPDTLLSAIGLL